ncbi:16S rRNA (cytidine(1402)-2'-O)-methyltransferase [Aeromicrobium sp. Leaf350]|uniref:16S rRNA (cytidine(1402)-2'-O)-methyltransferase n=1 Tax=Aeromicrobium sp. Leaf350 TaxID=2876565 RepID=UPI001E31881D|nr:16S rRNA (cytidine(1402)-2'-O)-methyltransferase [Aeromicrobium sp. Leaf350]
MLILAGTSIGQVSDVSRRLGPALSSADVVAAEDTRRLARLTAELGIETRGRIVSFFEGNEQARTTELVDLLRVGYSVVLVTDAGMPSISDPGYRLVAEAVAAGIDVSVIPGPSAVLTALAISGLPVDRFTFEGFLPRKPKARDRFLADVAAERRTLVFFESPHRTESTLRAMHAVFGPERRVVVCRELTKTYEEVVRGTTLDLLEWVEGLEQGVRGEITIVVEGAAAEEVELDPDVLADLVDRAEATGLSRKDAIAHVASTTGAPKNLVYDAAHA